MKDRVSAVAAPIVLTAIAVLALINIVQKDETINWTDGKSTLTVAHVYDLKWNGTTSSCEYIYVYRANGQTYFSESRFFKPRATTSPLQCFELNQFQIHCFPLAYRNDDPSNHVLIYSRPMYPPMELDKTPSEVDVLTEIRKIRWPYVMPSIDDPALLSTYLRYTAAGRKQCAPSTH